MGAPELESDTESDQSLLRSMSSGAVSYNLSILLVICFSLPQFGEETNEKIEY